MLPDPQDRLVRPPRPDALLTGRPRDGSDGTPKQRRTTSMKIMVGLWSRPKTVKSATT